MSVVKLFKKATTYHQQDKLGDAEKYYRKALKEDEKHVSSLYNLALLLQQKGDSKSAKDLYQKVVSIKPDYANAYNSLGMLFQQERDFESAIRNFEKAVKLKPSTVFYTNLGGQYILLGQRQQAEQAFVNAVKLDSKNAVALLGLANIYNQVERYSEAEKYYKQVLYILPENLEALRNLAGVHENGEDFTKAEKLLRQALKIEPENPKLLASLLTLKQKICDWDGFEELRDKVIENPEGIRPFSFLSICNDPERNLEVARSASEKIKERLPGGESFDFSNRKDKKKIRLGYLSADFGQHPFGHITKYLFEAHNKEQFEVYAYATTKDDGGEVRKKYESDADKFVDISQQNDRQAAGKIYEDEIDILIDCTCHTRGARMEIAVQMPAPVQVNVWGYVGSAGADFIDYIVVDETVLPDKISKYAAEEKIYLPDTLQIAHSYEKISDKEIKKSDFGIPDDAFVFSCHCPTYKMEPVMFGLWMELLKEVEGAVLWLRKASDIAMENILKEVEKRGVDRNRIVFAGKVEERPDYFRRLQLADLCLDTRIYNGGSTTMDALWAGVPYITVLGNNYQSRMAAGIINAAGLPELITNNLEEYKELALRLAKNPEQLKKLRAKVWDNRNSSALFNTEKYVGNLEKAYHEIWQNYLQGNNPRKIIIK